MLNETPEGFEMEIRDEKVKWAMIKLLPLRPWTVRLLVAYYVLLLAANLALIVVISRNSRAWILNAIVALWCAFQALKFSYASFILKRFFNSVEAMRKERFGEKTDG